MPKPLNFPSNQNKEQKVPINHVDISIFRPINFLNRIRLVIKAVNNLRMRTSQRTLKGLQEKQLEWLNDETYVHLKNEKKYYLKRYTSINVTFFLFFIRTFFNFSKFPLFLIIFSYFISLSKKLITP